MSLHPEQHAVTAAATGVSFAAILGYLPSLSVTLAIVWYAIIIGEKIAAWRKRVRQAKNG